MLPLRVIFLTAALWSAPAIAGPGSVDRFESEGLGPVNTWWVETGRRSLVVFDAQRSPEAAAAAIAAIRERRMPVRAILITHPHPDHVTGLGAFRAAFPAAQLIAQAPTATEMAADTQKLLSAEGNPLPPPPTRIVGDERFVIDGLTIEARQIGAGESVAQTVYALPAQRILFAADLATPTLVPFLAEGRTAAWLRQLAALRSRYAGARLLPGHGPEARLDAAVDTQTAWLTAYRDGIRSAMRGWSPGGRTVTPEEVGTLDAALAARFGTVGQVAGLPPEKLSTMNAEAVGKEFTGR